MKIAVSQTVAVNCGRVDVSETVTGPYIGYSSLLYELLAGFVAILDRLMGQTDHQR